MARTAVATAAIKNALGGDSVMNISRSPEIMADAAYVILTKNSREFTGNFCIDDNLLAENGTTDFSKYAEVPFSELAPDFFVPDDIEPLKQQRIANEISILLLFYLSLCIIFGSRRKED